ncbi:MAG: phosphotriesterase-related protein [Lentisphaeria bacterium]|jgi:phosphotriesterase-related protein|nr:phosphotriesterase-related protein [Lentisphaeria bacterium]
MGKPHAQTVTGPVPVDQLGFTLVHEHFSFNYPGWYADATLHPYDPAMVKELALKWLADVRSAGVRTVVDLTPNDCAGRDPGLFRELALESGVNIICGTGLYFEGGGAPQYWKSRQNSGRDIAAEIAEMMIAEVACGIGRTGIRAGVLKVGSSHGEITPYERQVFQAACLAQQATGVPIFTHTEGPTMGPEQAALLAECGADLDRVAIGHMNNASDLAYFLAILETAPGVTISFDRTGCGSREHSAWTARAIADLVAMPGKDYGSRIVLSHDFVPCWPGRPRPNTQSPDRYPTFVATGFHDLLLAAGVSEAQFRQMTVDNPARLYAATR